VAEKSSATATGPLRAGDLQICNRPTANSSSCAGALPGQARAGSSAWIASQQTNSTSSGSIGGSGSGAWKGSAPMRSISSTSAVACSLRDRNSRNHADRSWPSSRRDHGASTARRQRSKRSCSTSAGGCSRRSEASTRAGSRSEIFSKSGFNRRKAGGSSPTSVANTTAARMYSNSRSRKSRRISASLVSVSARAPCASHAHRRAG